MFKTYLYIPEELEDKINFTAKIQKRTKAEVIRQAIQEGLKIVQKPKSSAEVLLEIAEKAHHAMRNEKLPRDLSVNHDYYLWGGEKKNSKVKP